jgi:exonuclease V
MELGKAREIPVLGVLDGWVVVGVIDQLQKNASEHIVLSDTKTRATPRVPTAPAKGTHLQLMLYKRLFDLLASGTLDVDTMGANLPGVSQHEPFSADFQWTLEDSLTRMGITGSHFNNLSALFPLMLSSFQMLGPCDQELEIHYVYQKDQSCLGTSKVLYDAEFVTATVKHVSSYWRGDRVPDGVPIEEAFKCRSCEYTDICHWRSHNAAHLGGS